jgi:hypothetical protein
MAELVKTTDVLETPGLCPRVGEVGVVFGVGQPGWSWVAFALPIVLASGMDILNNEEEEVLYLEFPDTSLEEVTLPSKVMTPDDGEIFVLSATRKGALYEGASFAYPATWFIKVRDKMEYVSSYRPKGRDGIQTNEDCHAVSYQRLFSFAAQIQDRLWNLLEEWKFRPLTKFESLVYNEIVLAPPFRYSSQSLGHKLGLGVGETRTIVKTLIQAKILVAQTGKLALASEKPQGVPSLTLVK